MYLAVIQARMNSTRFPGKVMADLGGVPILKHIIDRVKRSRVDSVIVATSSRPEDHVIHQVAANEGVGAFAGDEHDVLSRYYDLSRIHKPKWIVRINGDSPLIEPEKIDRLVEKGGPGGGLTYVGYKVNNTPSVLTSYALPEMMSCAMVTLLHRYAQAVREHVTFAAHSAPPRYESLWIRMKFDKVPHTTVDEPPDLQRLAIRYGYAAPAQKES